MTLPGSKPLPRQHFWPPRDRQDIVQPHRGESIGWLRAVPHMLRFFEKIVPEDFWIESTDKGVSTIIVSCPCGEDATLHFKTRSYTIAECGCGRFFLWDGKAVRVGKEDRESDSSGAES